MLANRGIQVDQAVTNYYDNPTPEAKAALVDRKSDTPRVLPVVESSSV